MRSPSPPARPAESPRRRRRIPAFHPVPVAARHDGWTPARQGAFIGLLAQSRSVAAACRLLAMGRESAYRLRRRRGAAGFAAAWDTALGIPHAPVDLTSAKSTGLDAGYRVRAGLVQVVMRRGRFAGTRHKADDSALIEGLAGHYRSQLREAAANAIITALQRRSA